MTDSREIAEPTREAKAHCIMQLSSVSIHKDDEESDDTDDTEEQEIVKNYFQVGEVLSVQGRNDVNPLEFKVAEINDNGDIIDLEITNRGEFTEEVFNTAKLIYKDMTDWLDIDSNYGLISDLQISRDNVISVKDLTGEESDEVETEWYPVNKIWNTDELPPESFGIIPDAYIKNQNEIYIKTDDGWKLNNKIYDYVSFKMPMNFGEEGTVCYNVFGKTWLKTNCGWYISRNVYNLGDAKTPDLNDYEMYDLVYYNEVIYDEKGNILKRITHRIYKCCKREWKDILYEYDWAEAPNDSFGNNMDMFIYPEGNYRVKVNGVWKIVPNEWRYDSIYLEDSFGDVHDIILYSGDVEAYNTYVKMAATEDHPNGYWKQVEKIWDLRKYKLGRIPVDVDLTWTIKNIIIDDVGDGFMYPTAVIFSEGNATAYVRIINDKIIDCTLLYGGDDYTTIPEINFVMDAPVLSKKYYQVWKQLLENNVLQDEMEQVINYFESTKTYTISRITNQETGDTFYWHISFN
jgi:hypothetical protein